MIDSSEEEIIHRSRTKKSTVHDYSTEEEEEYSTEFDPFFLEVFGTGKEYDYIYENINDAKEDDSDGNFIELPEIERIYDEFDCYEYVRNNSVIDDEIGREVVDMLFQKEAIEYIVFHCEYCTIQTAYYIKSLVDDYFAYAKLLATKNAEGIFNQGSVIPDSLISLMGYKGDDVDLNIDGILNCKQFALNIISKERIHEPAHMLNPEKIDTVVRRQIINQISVNPIFVDRVFKIYEKYILKNVINDMNRHEISEYLRLLNAKLDMALEGELIYELKEAVLANLSRYFTEPGSSPQHNYRNDIVKEAFINVTKEPILRSILENFNAIGLISCKNGLQYFSNLLVSLQGRFGVYGGIFLERDHIKCVIVNEMGEVISKKSFGTRDSSKVDEFFSGLSNVMLTSTTINVRFFIQDSHLPIAYIPYSLLGSFDSKDSFAPALAAASIIQNPVLYFSKMHFQLYDPNYRSISSKIETGTNNLRYSTDDKILKNAIRIAAATNKLDWQCTLAHKSGYAFFNILKINLSEKYADVEHIDEMKNLEAIFEGPELNTIYTYFNLNSSKRQLDRTTLHPRNYRGAAILCKTAIGLLDKSIDMSTTSNSVDAENNCVSRVLENPKVLDGLDVENNLPGCISTKNIVKMLSCSNSYFQGAPDKMIFEDVVPYLPISDDPVTGVVTKVGTDFYLACVQGATVYIRKTCDLDINQTVDLKIIEANHPFCTYAGEVLSKKINCNFYARHRLYYEINEDDMIKNQISLAVRPSSKENNCFLSIKISDKIVVSFRLVEFHEDFENPENVFYTLTAKNTESLRFSSIDEFIDTYVKKYFRTLRNVAGFKYFFKDLESAQSHVSQPSEFMKYAVCLSLEHPGYLEFIISKSKYFIKVTAGALIYKNKNFPNIEEFINYAKREYPDL